MPAEPSRPAPLLPVLGFTWLNSLGTGAVTNGVFFLTKSRFEVSALHNFSLSLYMGVVYVVGALTIGGVLRRAAVRRGRLTPRGALAAQMLALAGACAVPPLIDRVWAVWVFVTIYMPLTGSLWPIVESYLSGARRGVALRRAVGLFNLSWASAIVVAYWGMAPLLDRRPLMVLAALGAIHALAIPALVFGFTPHPPHHVEERATPHPPLWRSLLVWFRWSLVSSYVLLAGLNPLLPWKLDQLGVGLAKQTIFTSTWSAGRLIIFMLLMVWHGWHGRRRTLTWTLLLMFGGFAVAVLAPTVAALEIGLLAFGVGMGGVYCAALYYALEVGDAEIDAGGKHEATIGAGYALGPLTGALAWSLVDAGAIEPSAAEPVMLGFVALTIAAIVVAGLLMSRRGATRVRRGKTSPE